MSLNYVSVNQGQDQGTPQGDPRCGAVWCHILPVAHELACSSLAAMVRLMDAKKGRYFQGFLIYSMDRFMM